MANNGLVVAADTPVDDFFNHRQQGCACSRECVFNPGWYFCKCFAPDEAALDKIS